MDFLRVCKYLLSLFSANDARAMQAKISQMFRVMAGKDISECGDTPESRFMLGEVLGEGSLETTNCLLVDSIALSVFTKDTEGIIMATSNGYSLATVGGFQDVSMGKFDDAVAMLANELGMTGDDSVDEIDEEDEMEDSYDDDEEMDFGEEDYEEESYTEDEESATGRLDEEEGIDDDRDETDVDKICQYYSEYYGGVIENLVKRYTALFESGYELIPFAGVITNDGLARLSGNSVKYTLSASIRSIYTILSSRLGLIECRERSNRNIANRIYTSYSMGRLDRLYFPYKVIEFAYGRKSPDGNDQESLNTYKEHSNSTNWRAYCKKEVIGSLGNVLREATVTFITKSFSKEKYFSDETRSSVRRFLEYLEMCLSQCLLMVEWKTSNDDYGSSKVNMFKARFYDGVNVISESIMSEILKEAFLGSSGDRPFTYDMMMDSITGVKEIAHEFDHDKAQAEPLFAYKAYLALKEQNIEPTVENMILGKAENGTIMRNGKNGVGLSNKLLHFIIAGSRAGKGVTVLNILASGIYSNRAIFYLDDKPDMATVFQHMCPEMFVINGQNIDMAYDDYGYFKSINSKVNWNNVPDYLAETFELGNGGKAWQVGYGTLFYMRALMFVMGIIAGRGKGARINPNFNGEDGIMLVVDEFTEFSEKFNALFQSALGHVPPIAFETDSRKVMDGSLKPDALADMKRKVERSYNHSTMYAISWLNGIAESLRYLHGLKNESFSKEEEVNSDIFVVGQELKYGPMDSTALLNALRPLSTGSRYKSSGYMGMSQEGKKPLELASRSVPMAMTIIKGYDAFYGRNESRYLAQGNPSSRAYGRLDDKASNFAYLGDYNDDVRKKILSGSESENIAIASKAVYFKPFLVINANTAKYVDQLKMRCENAGLPLEDIIADNSPVDNDPSIESEGGTGLTNMVGFRGYMAAMNISNLEERLAKSGQIANYIVQNLIGYPGTWFEFITDLRPEWIFSVSDIAELVAGSDRSLINLLHPETSPILKEYNEFVAFNRSETEDDISGETMSDFLDERGDFSEFEYDRNDSEARMYERISEGLEEGLKKYYPEEDESDDEEDDIFDEEFDLDEDDFEERVHSRKGPWRENKVNGYNEQEQFDKRYSRVEDALKKSTNVFSDEVEYLLNRLRELGVDVTPTSRQRYSDFDYESISPDEMYVDRNERKRENRRYRQSDRTVFDQKFNFNDGEYSDSLSNVVELITKDVLAKFGGASAITSFRVRGGSIFVNNTCYACNISKRAAMSLPYDLRAEIGSGNISRLFNYASLFQMRHLRYLELESPEFIYDYVSQDMGYGARVSIDLFFRDLPIQTLVVGKSKFDRRTYREQLNGSERDVFYNPRFYTRVADFSERYLDSAFKNSWAITKSAARNRNHSILRRTVETVGGGALTATSGVAKASLKILRGGVNGLRKLGKSVSQVWDEYDKNKR